MSATGPAWWTIVREARIIGDITEAPVTGIELDSRAVMPGNVFVAVPGASFDGHDFIGAALERGATAVVVQADRGRTWQAFEGKVPLVIVPDARIALAQAAAGCYGRPARALGVVGVTGTDGKTTTTHLIAHVLSACGLPAGYLSSVAFGLPDSAELNATHMTTVEAPAIQRHLARIRDAGARFAIIEASSHGLDMHRVDECEFDVGVFTNLTRDHLDYHGTMERYRDAKATLFRMLDRSLVKAGIAKAAVVNADDEASGYMRGATRANPITYGVHAEADVAGGEIRVGRSATDVTVRTGGRTFEASVPLLGAFNAYNALAAIAVALSQGIDPARAVAALASFPGVPGRMEIIDEGQPFRVVVDIASTEQAMRNVLGVLRPITQGRLIVLFGAAGERDRERRHGLARAVAAHADLAIIANEDPRSEEPEVIISDIARALESAGVKAERVRRIADRREAMRVAFREAGAGDTVLLAGKGSEQSIVIGTTHYPWDEREVARELLRGLGL